jgi:hypothetical protein
MKFDVIEYLGKFDGVMVLISLNYNDVLWCNFFIKMIL